MLTRVWDEMDYRIDVYRITKSGHIEHLWHMFFKKKNVVRLSAFQCNKIWYPLRSLFTANFLNVSWTYKQPFFNVGFCNRYSQRPTAGVVSSTDNLIIIYTRHSTQCISFISITRSLLWLLIYTRKLRAEHTTQQLNQYTVITTAFWTSSKINCFHAKFVYLSFRWFREQQLLSMKNIRNYYVFKRK
jgi:hypothetical protein